MTQDLYRGGAFRVFDIARNTSPKDFLNSITVGTAFVVRGKTAQKVAQARKVFDREAQRLGVILRWDEHEVDVRRERVVISGLAPNVLTKRVITHKQHGLLRAARPYHGTRRHRQAQVEVG